MLAALLAGEVDPRLLAELARGRMRAKRDLLEQSLQGQFKSHHRVQIGEQLADIDALDEAIERMSTEIAQRIHPYEQQLQRLETPAERRSTPLTWWTIVFAPLFSFPPLIDKIVDDEATNEKDDEGRDADDLIPHLLAPSFSIS
jgi:hypothetical protein